MNKLLTILLMIAGMSAMAQSASDSLANSNNQRLNELKSKLKQMEASINANEKRTVDNLEILEYLKGLDAKISRIALRQDSIVDILGKVYGEKLKEKPIAPNGYYLILESQRTADRAKVALENFQSSMDNVAIRTAVSGRWHFIIIDEEVRKEALQTELLRARKIVPTAWYLKGDQLLNELNK